MKKTAVLKRTIILSIIVFSIWLFWPAMPEKAVTKIKPLIVKSTIQPISSKQQVNSPQAIVAPVLPDKITSNE